MTNDAILVPLDGSALSEAALPYAMTLARVEAAGLDLLGVIETMGLTPEAKRLESLLTEGMQLHLGGIAEDLRTAGLTAHPVLRHGNPAEVILAEAEQRRARLIVMTTRGQGGLTRWLVGSVAEKVMHLADCPVLLVRPDSTAVRRLQPWQPKRLLVPLDGSDFAGQALPMAYRWAAALRAEVLVASLQPWVIAHIPAYNGYLPDVVTLDAQVEQAAAEYLATTVAQAPAVLRVTNRLVRGEPASCLLDLIEQQHIDLVVMTSHGRGGIRRLVLGSVADRLVHSCAAPVLIVHPLASATDTPKPVGTAAAAPATV